MCGDIVCYARTCTNAKTCLNCAIIGRLTFCVHKDNSASTLKFISFVSYWRYTGVWQALEGTASLYARSAYYAAVHWVLRYGGGFLGGPCASESKGGHRAEADGLPVSLSARWPRAHNTYYNGPLGRPEGAQGGLIPGHLGAQDVAAWRRAMPMGVNCPRVDWHSYAEHIYNTSTHVHEGSMNGWCTKLRIHKGGKATKPTYTTLNPKSSLRWTLWALWTNPIGLIWLSCDNLHGLVWSGRPQPIRTIGLHKGMLTFGLVWINLIWNYLGRSVLGWSDLIWTDLYQFGRPSPRMADIPNFRDLDEEPSNWHC